LRGLDPRIHVFAWVGREDRGHLGPAGVAVQEPGSTFVRRAALRPSASLAARRRQLIEMLQAERCRLAPAVLPVVRNSLEQVIAALRESLEALEA
jgi:hypothetical protein